MSSGIQYSDFRIYRSATMSSANGSTPTGIPLHGYRLAGLNVSSGWNAADRMTFKVGDAGSATSVTYRSLYTPTAEAQIASAVMVSTSGIAVSLSNDLSLQISAHQFVKFRAGPATASAAPSTQVTITAVLVPFERV